MFDFSREALKIFIFTEGKGKVRSGLRNQFLSCLIDDRMSGATRAVFKK